MPTPQDLEARFWTALGTDMTMMVGLDGVDDGHARPMTAQLEGASGPIWFFTATDNGIVEALRGRAGGGGRADRAIATFASKDHEVFATVHGSLSVSTDRAVIDKFWSPFIAAWYPGGKEDPKLVLLRLDAESGEVWLNERSVFAGMKMLLGADPRETYKDKVAKVDLR